MRSLLALLARVEINLRFERCSDLVHDRVLWRVRAVDVNIENAAHRNTVGRTSYRQDATQAMVPVVVQDIEWRGGGVVRRNSHRENFPCLIDVALGPATTEDGGLDHVPYSAVG